MRPPSPAARLLWPLSRLYGWLEGRRRRAAVPWHAPCPVVVVGNLVAGGAGKTPTVIALVHALRERGWTPGVVSRGYGRRTRGVRVVAAGSPAVEVGDEPWLIHRATGAPLVVGEERVAAVQRLLQHAPAVDVVIGDDGLQHAALGRDVELWLFDERGVGNGWMLPAGPLRQPLPPAPPERALVLYNADAPTTPWPGPVATRALAGAASLDDWTAGAPMRIDRLDALRGRTVVAMAGIAAPQRFFAMLRQRGLEIDPLPLPDHAALDRAPWPAGTADVVCTEKDASKLVALPAAALGATRVWVVGLDFQLPATLVDTLHQRLRAARERRAAGTARSLP